MDDNHKTAQTISEYVGVTIDIPMTSAGPDSALETTDVALIGYNLCKLPFTVKLNRNVEYYEKEYHTFTIAIKILALLGVSSQRLTAILSDISITILI